MIISKNWLNEFIDVSNLSTEKICEKLNSIGLEVDSLRKLSVPERVVVAKVETCEAHENSDHLHVCSVNVGNETLQIVCGAPNVATGQIVACALEGAKMPNGLQIKKAKLRGVESNGMLCSASELGLPKLNDGIMLLDESVGELILGKELREFGLFNDDIIEIELTPNRGDCLSINGVARDLSAAFDLPLREFETKEDDDKLLGIGRILSLHGVEKIDSSFSYRALEIKNTLKISLKTALRLALIDCTAKTPISKVLEYVTHATGVLFRAYDYDKISSQREQKLIFDFKTLPNGACGVFYGDKCLSLAGISQSDDVKIDENSTFIVIEANYSCPEVVSSAIGEDKFIKKDELSYRSTRGSEPNLNIGMNLLFKLFFKNKNIAPYAGVQQIHCDQKIPTISFSVSELCATIGTQVPRNDVIKILKRLGFEVSFNAEQEQIYVKAPIYRHDISHVQDICEEIVRIIGIENIPAKPLKFSEANRLNATSLSYKNATNLRVKAAAAGFFECVHYIFDNPSELKMLGFVPCKTQILNPISGEFAVLKPTLLNHLIGSCERNFKNSKKSIKLFEYGEIFDEFGNQSSKFALICSGFTREPSIQNGAKPSEIDFFAFANSLQNILGKIELKNGKNISFLSEFEQARVFQNGVDIGFLGRLDLGIEMSKDLPKTYLCELDFEKIDFSSKKAKEYSKFPSVSRDLSLLVPKDLAYDEIKKCIESLNLDNLKGFLPVDIYEDKNLKDARSLTLKLTFQNIEKTLLDDEISGYIEKILNSLKEKLQIGLR